MISPKSNATTSAVTQIRGRDEDRQSPQSFKDGHLVHRITASNCSVEGNIPCIPPSAIPSNPVPLPSLFVRNSSGKAQPINEQTHVSCKVTSSRNIGSQKRPHFGELAEIDLNLGQIIQCRVELACSTDELLIWDRPKEVIHRTASRCVNRIAGAEPFESNLCPVKGSDVNRSKDRIYPPTRKVPPDCGTRQRGKNTKHRPNTGPCIPVNCASAAEVPALADAIQNAHFLIPLWIPRHSATAQLRRELAHG